MHVISHNILKGFIEVLINMANDHLVSCSDYWLFKTHFPALTLFWHKHCLQIVFKTLPIPHLLPKNSSP